MVFTSGFENRETTVMGRTKRATRGAVAVAAIAATMAVWGPPTPAAADPVCAVTDQVTLTSGGQNVNVSYSGDGSRMAFVSNRNFAGDNADGNNEIFVYDVATATYTQVTVTSGSGGVNVPSISSAGTRVAFQSSKNLTGDNADGNNEIFLYDATVPSITQVSETPAAATNAAPKISSDGTHIAFSSSGDIGGGNADLNQEIYLHDTAGPTTTQVTNTTVGINGSPSISSTGARVAFRSNRDITGGNPELNNEIFLYDTTGPMTTQITTATSGASDGPSLSADGTRIAFRSTADLVGTNADKNQEIYRYDSTGPTTTQVTVTTTGSSDGPSISADGTRIAFKSNTDLVGDNTDLTNEIFAYDTVDGITQITATPVGGGGNRAPAMSGDGTGIAFESDRNIGGTNGDFNYEIHRTACGLTVTKAADQTTVPVGGTIDYHVTLQNNGTLPLTGLFVSDENAPGCSDSLPDLPVGQSVTVDCTYTPTLADVGILPNVAIADSDQTPPITSNQVDVDVTFPVGSGAVAGTVTESGSGAPLPGSWVAILDTSDFSLAGAAVTDGVGAYSTIVATGDYFLYLIDPGATHAYGFHGAPTTVTVAAAATTGVDPTMAPTRGSITGTLTAQETGDPLTDALVLAVGGPSSSPERAVTTDAAGGFTLDPLPTGPHWVAYVDPTGAHQTEFYPHSTNVPDATPVTVTAGDSTVADGSLPPQAATPGGAALSGTVTETGTGEPLGDAVVVALRAADYQLARATVTDGAGEYLLDVEPGDYKLAFFDMDGSHRMEWYDDEPNTGLGDAVTVVAPAATDVTLDRVTGTMSGTITDDPSGTPVAGAWVVAFGEFGIAGGAVTAADGTYTIPGLPVGTYHANFVDPPGGRVQEYWDDSTVLAGADPFTITSAATTTVDAALAGP